MYKIDRRGEGSKNRYLGQTQIMSYDCCFLILNHERKSSSNCTHEFRKKRLLSNILNIFLLHTFFPVVTADVFRI